MKQAKIVLAAIGVAMVSAAAQAEVGVTDTEIKIGEVSILSGTTSQIGAGFTAGTRVAVAEINAKGGINGRKLVLVEEDDGAQPARGFQAAKKLIQEDQVFSFNGTSCSACVSAMLPLFEQNNVPVIVSLAPIQAVYSPLRPNIFTIGASYTEAFFASIKYIHQNREPKDAVYGLVRMDEAFGESIELAYTRAVKAFGLKDGIKLRYKPGQTDFATEALQLKQAGINVLIDGAVTSGAASLFTNLRKAGATMEFANVWTELMPASMKLQATAGYTYLVADYVADVNEPAGQKVVELAKKYAPNDVAAINRYTFMSYVSMQVFAAAATKCGKDLTRACLISELAKTKDLDVGGLMAPITFDKAEQRAGRLVRIYEVDSAKQTVKALTDFQ